MTTLQGFVKANTEEMALPYSRTNGLAGVEIVAVGESDTYRALTDSEGKFEIVGIPANEYEVRRLL